jgi:hypothetical protein
VIWKSFWAALMLCILAACGRNVGPGDAQYPILNTKPQRTIDITLIEEKSVRPVFRMEWWAKNMKGPYEGTCTFWHPAGGGAIGPQRWPYSITVPLSFTNEGGVLRSHFAFDLYEPGLCGYEFIALSYRVDPGVGATQLPLITYKDDPSMPVEVSVDLWCFPASSTDDWCDTMSAAAIQNVGRAEQYRIPRLPTPEQAAAAKVNGDHEPPALVGPNTRSLIIRVNDARIN